METKNEAKIKKYLFSRSNGIPAEDFAEDILRNFSVEQRKKLGNTIIEQAYNLLHKRLNS